jgi:hypothetical protein
VTERETNWQPNSTAPTDGTEIFAYWDKSNDMQIVYFDCEHPEEPGWRDVYYNFQVVFPFSHWMPLPAPPTKEKE